MRYPSHIRDRALSEYQAGDSSNTVGKRFGIAGCTVWRWAKEKGITRDLKTAVRLSKGGPPLRADYERESDSLSYISGVCMGDGTIGEARVCLLTVDKDFADTFHRHAEGQFGVHIGRGVTPPRADGRKKQHRVTIYSSDVSALMRRVCTSDWVRSQSVDRKALWLRGAWDSEGTITLSGTSARVAFGVCDLEFATLYRDVLNEACGIDRPVSGPYGSEGLYIVGIYSSNDIRRFYHIVKPTIQRKVNRFKKYMET